ncbi:MAG: hypothetical protein BWY09_02048 [Candidatus Hydrogenedentes bacterium ADurb.Bin179]|nr:MAG: hypothetical protein BWY09_02048 [Candidatus Hydrogenedentes bacterium ADurb.Bin179]
MGDLDQPVHGVIGVDHRLPRFVLDPDQHARAVILESGFIVVMIANKRNLRLGAAAPAADTVRIFEFRQFVHRVEHRHDAPEIVVGQGGRMIVGIGRGGLVAA